MAKRIKLYPTDLPVAFGDLQIVRGDGGESWNIHDKINNRVIGTSHPSRTEAQDALDELRKRFGDHEHIWDDGTALDDTAGAPDHVRDDDYVPTTRHHCVAPIGVYDEPCEATQYRRGGLVLAPPRPRIFGR